MTQKEFARLGRSLQHSYSELRRRRSLLILPPVRHVLRGVLLGRSIDTRSFYVSVFVQALYIPADSISLTLGWRLGGGSYAWRADDANISNSLQGAIGQEALPFLRSVQSARDLLAYVDSRSQGGPWYAKLTRAYTLAFLGRTQEAVSALCRLRKGFELEIPWQREAEHNARTLMELLKSDQMAAHAQLERWELETIENLGLTEFADTGEPANRSVTGPF